MFKVDELVERAQETLSSRRVFGEAIRQDGVTVIPVADVSGGGGGGGGRDADGQEGTGGGFGLRARPVGVYVIDGGKVTWQPAVDVNRLASTLAGAVVAYLLYRWRVTAIRERPSTRLLLERFRRGSSGRRTRPRRPPGSARASSWRDGRSARARSAT